MKTDRILVDADYLLGRRFEFTGNEASDVTIVAVDPKRGTCRLHALSGQCETVSTIAVLTAIAAGALVESTGAPFVNDNLPKMRRESHPRLVWTGSTDANTMLRDLERKS